MKTLLILRHAKSSHEDGSLKDLDRPLNERGISDAKLMGSVIRKKKIQPDLIVASPAERVRQTADLALKAARLNVELTFDKPIYEASAQGLLKVLRDLNDTSNTLMLIGHNPGLEDLLERLTGEGITLPTAALAGVELNVEHWSEVRTGAGKLMWRVTPRELKSK
jgi:phosphohistidine phosphatase